jgi:hypothetical protein
MPYEDVSGLQSGVAPGINPIRRIQFEDGTYGYIKYDSVGGLKREVVAGFMLETIGVRPSEGVIMFHGRDEQGDNVVFMEHRENDGRGYVFNGDVADLVNAREIALFDHLFHGEDRHNGNWLFKDNVAIPIDHGHAFGGYGFGVFNDEVRNFVADATSPNDIFRKDNLIALRARLVEKREVLFLLQHYSENSFSRMLARLDTLIRVAN